MKIILQLLLFLQFITSGGFAVDEATQKNKHPLRLPQFSTMLSLIYAANLNGVFVGTGPFTIFAPNNSAFEKLGKTKLDELQDPKNKDRLIDVLIYHVVPGKYFSKNLKSMEIQTIKGKKIQIQVENGQITVNKAKVVNKEIIGPNAVVYEIDTVLNPQ